MDYCCPVDNHQRVPSTWFLLCWSARAAVWFYSICYYSVICHICYLPHPVRWGIAQSTGLGSAQEFFMRSSNQRTQILIYIFQGFGDHCTVKLKNMHSTQASSFFPGNKSLADLIHARNSWTQEEQDFVLHSRIQEVLIFIRKSSVSKLWYTGDGGRRWLRSEEYCSNVLLVWK